MNILQKLMLKSHYQNVGNKFEQGNIQRDMYSAFLIMNTKDNLKEIDVDRATATFENFFKLHNKEIDRIKSLK